MKSPDSNAWIKRQLRVKKMKADRLYWENMKTEILPQPLLALNCDCKIKLDNNGVMHWEQCAMHGAAAKMYEALKRICRDKNTPNDCYLIAKQAIACADNNQQTKTMKGQLCEQAS